MYRPSGLYAGGWPSHMWSKPSGSCSTWYVKPIVWKRMSKLLTGKPKLKKMMWFTSALYFQVFQMSFAKFLTYCPDAWLTDSLLLVKVILTVMKQPKQLQRKYRKRLQQDSNSWPQHWYDALLTELRSLVESRSRVSSIYTHYMKSEMRCDINALLI